MRCTKTLAVVAAVALALASLSACSSKSRASTEAAPAAAARPEKALKIGYLPITHSAPLMLHAAGDGQRIELVKFASWPELTDALNGGRIDGAVTMLELAFASASKGVPLKLLALSHRGGDVLTVSRDIDGVRDLKGGRVGIPHRLSGQNLLLNAALDRGGLGAEDVQRVEMAPSEMPAALARGDLAGYVVAEPFGTLGVAQAGGKVLARAEELLPGWVCCALVMREDVVRDEAAEVQRLVDGFVAAGASVSSDTSKAAETAARYTKYDAKVWTRSLALGVRYDDLVPSRQELVGLQDDLVTLRLMSEPIDVSAFLDDTFVKKAYAER